MPAAADLLQISERTVRGWESGATRIPYAAFKLLRVLKGGRLLEHPHWAHFVVRGPVLFTPEGHALQAGDLGWLSLLVRRARAFGELLATRNAEEAHRAPREDRGREAAPDPATGALPPVLGVSASPLAGRPRPALCSEGRHSGGEATPRDASACFAGEVRRLPATNRGVSETEQALFSGDDPAQTPPQHSSGGECAGTPARLGAVLRTAGGAA